MVVATIRYRLGSYKPFDRVHGRRSSDSILRWGFAIHMRTPQTAATVLE